jgi:Recombinase
MTAMRLEARPATAGAPRAAVSGHRRAAERLVYSREQAARALGVSLATLDRRVVPAIATVKTEWGARLIPAVELERYLAARPQEPWTPPRHAARSGRRSALPPEVVDRIRRERANGASLAEIARQLNRDAIPTGQGGRQWWPSTVRAVLLGTESCSSAAAGDVWVPKTRITGAAS